MEQSLVKISKSQDSYIVIDKSVDIEISNGVNVNILIQGNGLSINILALVNSNVTILSLDSSNNNININNSGTISFIELTLEKTDSILNVELNEEYSIFNLKELAVGKEYDITLKQNVIHNKKYSTSNINNYGIALEGSKILFETTGKINKGMSKSKCVQLSHGVIMDDESQVTSKPILLIDEYDVVANHGAAIGKMSDEVMFYLMSRGLSKNEAFLLYLDGIINPFLSEINDESLQKLVHDKINKLIER